MTTPLLQEDKAADDAGRDAGRDAERIAELRKEVEKVEGGVLGIVRVLASITALATLLIVFYQLSAWILSKTADLTGLESCMGPVTSFDHFMCFCGIVYFWLMAFVLVSCVFIYVINPIYFVVRGSLRYCRSKRELARLLRKQKRQEGEKGEGVGV